MLIELRASAQAAATGGGAAATDAAATAVGPPAVVGLGVGAGGEAVEGAVSELVDEFHGRAFP